MTHLIMFVFCRSGPGGMFQRGKGKGELGVEGAWIKIEVIQCLTGFYVISRNVILHTRRQDAITMRADRNDNKSYIITARTVLFSPQPYPYSPTSLMPLPDATTLEPYQEIPPTDSLHGRTVPSTVTTHALRSSRLPARVAAAGPVTLTDGADEVQDQLAAAGDGVGVGGRGYVQEDDVAGLAGGPQVG